MNDPKLPGTWHSLNRKATRPEPARGNCPNAEALALLAVDPGQAEPELLDHVAVCSSCSEELKRVLDDGTLAALTTALAGEPTASMDTENPSGSGHRGWRRRALGGLALAASLLIAVAVSLTLQPVDNGPTLRGGPAVEGLHPPSGAHLEQAPSRFEWPAGGRDEELVLMNSRAEIIWTGPEVRDGAVMVPESLRDALVEDRYYWQVRDLEHNSLLGPFEFRLVQP